MRWPWQPKPGFVRISQKRYIELLQDALRTHDLEDRVRECRLRTAQANAQALVYESALERRISNELEAVRS